MQKQNTTKLATSQAALPIRYHGWIIYLQSSGKTVSTDGTEVINVNLELPPRRAVRLAKNKIDRILQAASKGHRKD